VGLVRGLERVTGTPVIHKLQNRGQVWLAALKSGRKRKCVDSAVMVGEQKELEHCHGEKASHGWDQTTTMNVTWVLFLESTFSVILPLPSLFPCCRTTAIHHSRSIHKALVSASTPHLHTDEADLATPGTFYGAIVRPSAIFSWPLFEHVMINVSAQ
jgi:hypothetical protein